MTMRRLGISRWLAGVCALPLVSATMAMGGRNHVLLVVQAHGDDNVAIAPLMARYAAEGHAVYYAVFTGLQDPAGEDGSPGRAETLCASNALGVRDTFVMRGPAGEGFATVAAIAERLIGIVNQTKPDVIVTWGPDGLTGHPRHIVVSNVVTRVFQQRRLMTVAPRKLYYVAFPESRYPDRADFGRLSERAFGTVSDELITTKVDGRRYLLQAKAAIGCHTLVRGGYETNAQWQQAWIDHTGKTLGGTVFLRLAAGRLSGNETDIFSGL